MQVKLRVMRGAHAGRDIVLARNQFVIGRGEECQLRPRSEAVSRRHCVVKIETNTVVVQDLGSKNGTYVNGQRIESEMVLKAGDQLQVGPLLFEVLIDHALGGAKRPVVKDVKEAAARTASAATEDELDITRWLEDDADTDTSRAVATPETRQFRLDDTNNLALDTHVGHEVEGDENEGAAGDLKVRDKDKQKDRRWKKGKPGRLPRKSTLTASDSREAAAEMLKRFFNRR